MVKRRYCLLHNARVVDSIKIFLGELENDNIKNSLSSCVKCKKNIKKKDVIELHCYLKTVYENMAEFTNKASLLELI